MVYRQIWQNLLRKATAKKGAVLRMMTMIVLKYNLK
jgi:hypothetical protein